MDASARTLNPQEGEVVSSTLSGGEMFNNILVAYDGSSSSSAAVQQAFELAHGDDAQVTVLSVAPSVAALATLGGVSIDQLTEELKQWAERTASEGASTAPTDVNVRTVTRSGHVGEEIVAEIEAGGYDLIVLGSRGRGRLTSELFGSANAYVHFHSTIPLLSISDGESNSDVVEAGALAGSAAH
jgi:nucleotide-binding universal stress UspA family protein